jgi:hypothetical protein
MTTIRVEAEVRDRLAALAATHSRSLGAELRAMLDEMMCRVSKLVTENWQPAGGDGGPPRRDRRMDIGRPWRPRRYRRRGIPGVQLLTSGDVLPYDLSPVAGREQGGIRPVLVVSHHRYSVIPRTVPRGGAAHHP